MVGAVRLLVLAALLALCRADLPIHCTNTDVAGLWLFEVTHANHGHFDQCGYAAPDQNSQHFHHDNDEKFVVEANFQVELRQPNLLIDDQGNEVGTWTMIYDEGFEIKHNGQTYFAFSKYEPKPGTDLSSDEVSEYESYCDATRVGWFHGPSSAKTFGCYRGKRMKTPEELESDESDFIELKLKKARVARNKAKHALREEKKKAEEQEPLKLDSTRPVISLLDTKAEDELPFKPDMDLIDRINNDPSSLWRAKVPESFEGKTVGNVRTYLGRRKFAKPTLRLPSLLEDATSAHTAQQTSSSTAFRENYPQNWDWRNMNGKSYVSAVVDQGACGSCYALATSSAMEARWRIKNNKPNEGSTKFKFAAQDVLSCSTMNQGCEGGYPFLVSKYGTDNGFIEESHFNYIGSDAPKCCRGGSCKNAQRFFAHDYHYVGGYYGACNEELMMEEIHKNGPVVIGFEAPDTLSYYMDGVFTGPSPVSEMNTEGVGLNPWEHTNHAVVCVGWGVDTTDGKETPYWIMQNTWGSSWGDNGFFKIRRGTDECAIESMAVAAQM